MWVWSTRPLQAAPSAGGADPRARLAGRFRSPMTSSRPTARTCALSLWKSAGSAWRGCYRVATRRCAMASNSMRRWPATARQSSGTPAVWGSRPSSPSACISSGITRRNSARALRELVSKDQTILSLARDAWISPRRPRHTQRARATNNHDKYELLLNAGHYPAGSLPSGCNLFERYVRSMRICLTAGASPHTLNPINFDDYIPGSDWKIACVILF